MKKAILIALIALVMLVASAGAAITETHSEVLEYDQTYVASGNAGWDAGGSAAYHFDFAWSLNFDTMPSGASILIAQTSTVKNATVSQVNFPFTATYNNTPIGGGTAYISNGTFSGKTHQIELYWTSFTIPPYGVTGWKDIVLNSSVNTAEGAIVTLSNSHISYGGSLGGVPISNKNIGEVNYVFSAPVNFWVHYTFTKDDSGVYRFSLTKQGYNTKATVYSPENTAAFTESTYNIIDRTDQAYINGGTARGGICSALAGGICLNTSWFFEPTYDMSITDHDIPQLGTTDVHITSSTGNYALLNAYTLTINSASGGGTATVGGHNPTWILTGGHWKQWNEATSTYSIDGGTSFPSTVTIGNWTAPGVYTVEATLFQTDGYGPPKMSDTVNVSGSDTYHTVTMTVIDSSTSGLIYGATGALKLPSGSWSNQTQASSAMTWSIGDGSYIGYSASATGYAEMGVAYTQVFNDLTLNIPMTPIRNVTAGNATLSAYVRTASGGAWVPVSGASVVCNGVAKTSPASGVVSFEVLQSTTYQITASKTGYNSVTRSVDVGTESTSVSLELSVLTVSPTTAVPTNAEGSPITTVPTVDVRTDDEKDADMMDLVRNNGEGLIGLFIVATIIYLAKGM